MKYSKQIEKYIHSMNMGHKQDSHMPNTNLTS